jgi:hypothetical protein
MQGLGSPRLVGTIPASDYFSLQGILPATPSLPAHHYPVRPYVWHSVPLRARSGVSLDATVFSYVKGEPVGSLAGILQHGAQLVGLIG